MTGSGRGIGRATAVALSPTYDVVIHYRRDAAAARAAAAEVERSGAAALVVRAELESANDLDRMVGASYERFGRVDAFVANAAAGAFRDLLDSRPRHARRTMETIVTSFVHLTTRLAPQMAPGGRIVAVSGADAGVDVPAHALIGAAKASLESLVRNLAVELGPAGITANAVRPGPIRTASSELYANLGPDVAELIADGIPAQRFGEPAEVAALIAFLCSPEAAYVSGATIPVDGGASASGGPWMALRKRLQAGVGA